ncbi:unnamed protein product [Orchesella dallaii]|uniref:Right handed beta helix domain-containing protein n=1 Tax=Orchesella dallaii TaxID=48710 RepID=A0ABP1PSL0_9HEXA
MKFHGSSLLSLLLVYCTTIEIRASVINVSNSQEFQQALDAAQPGDEITLQSGIGILKGPFVATPSGTLDAPIKITGAEGASGFIKSEQATGLSITGNYWRIEGIHFLITKPSVGVIISGNNNLISNVLISGIESGLQVTGNENVVKNCVISASQGSGLFVGGNNNEFESNVFSSPITAATLNGCCGKFYGDVFNGDVIVQGLSSSASMKTVRTSQELQDALNQASAGDVITLAPVTFRGEFLAKQSGAPSNPITIVAGLSIRKHPKIVGNGGGAGLTITGNYWNLKYFAMSDYDVGVLVKGAGNLVDGLSISNANKAVVVKGKGNAIKNCAIDNSHLGIKVDASNCLLSSNSIQGSGASLLVSKGTCCGRLEYNVASGKVEVQGSGYSISGNVFTGPTYPASLSDL